MCYSNHCTLNKAVYVLAHATCIPATFEACSPTDLVLFARSFFLCFWEKEGLGICVWNILMWPQRSDTLGWITWECEEGNMPEKYRNGTMTDQKVQPTFWSGVLGLECLCVPAWTIMRDALSLIISLRINVNCNCITCWVFFILRLQTENDTKFIMNRKSQKHCLNPPESLQPFQWSSSCCSFLQSLLVSCYRDPSAVGSEPSPQCSSAEGGGWPFHPVCVACRSGANFHPVHASLWENITL